jgi:hypothetical protein
MNIQALDIKVGDCAVRTARGNRIIAYCKQKRQVCTVQRLVSSTHNNITLKVTISVPYRESASCVVQYHPDALVEMAGLKSRSQPDSNYSLN